MIKINKDRFQIFFNLVSKSGSIKHCFCVPSLDAVDVCTEVAYYEKKVDSKNLFVIVDNSSYKFVFFYKNFVCYFAEVPTSSTLVKLKEDIEL